MLTIAQIKCYERELFLNILNKLYDYNGCQLLKLYSVLTMSGGLDFCHQ